MHSNSSFQKNRIFEYIRIWMFVYLEHSTEYSKYLEYSKFLRSEQLFEQSMPTIRMQKSEVLYSWTMWQKYIYNEQIQKFYRVPYVRQIFCIKYPWIFCTTSYTVPSMESPGWHSSRHDQNSTEKWKTTAFTRNWKDEAKWATTVGVELLWSR